ncbi:hypothetical protein BDV10DRAFT_173221 [Aspergillus recurvatus]
MAIPILTLAVLWSLLGALSRGSRSAAKLPPSLAPTPERPTGAKQSGPSFSSTAKMPLQQRDSSKGKQRPWRRRGVQVEMAVNQTVCWGMTGMSISATKANQQPWDSNRRIASVSSCG